MDPDGCLAHNSAGGAPLSVASSYVFTCGALLAATGAALVGARTAHRGACCGAANGRVPHYGIPTYATVKLLTAVTWALTLPGLAFFLGATAANAGAPGTSTADAACVVGSGVPAVAAVLASLCVLMVATAPLRRVFRDSTAAAAVAAVGLAPASDAATEGERRGSGSTGPTTTAVTAVVMPAGRGFWVPPVVRALLGSRAGGSGPGRVVRLLAVDAYGTPACREHAAAAAANLAAELGVVDGDGSGGDGREVLARVARYDGRPIAGAGTASVLVCAPLPLPARSADAVVLPFLWGTSSEAVPGEDEAGRAARVAGTLAEARRVLRPGGRAVALVPFFKAGAAARGLASAGFERAATVSGLHWLSFLPVVLVTATAPATGTDGGASEDSSGGVQAVFTGPDKVAVLGGDNDDDDDGKEAEQPQPAATGGSAAQRAARAALLLAAIAAGVALVAVLLLLLREHWVPVSSAVRGGGPGLPFAFRAAAGSIALQLNVVTGLLLLAHEAWVAGEAADHAPPAQAPWDEAGGATRQQEGGVAPLLGDPLPSKQRRHPLSPPAFSAAVLRRDAAAAARVFSLSFAGSIALTVLTWAPPFGLDLLWLAVAPPASQASFTGVNTAVQAVLPLVVTMAVRRRWGRGGGDGTETGVGPLTAGAPPHDGRIAQP
jgi:hypothetical protein